MQYDDYLMTLYQLASQKRASVVVQGSVIFIETTPKNKQWSLMSRVFEGEDKIPSSIREVSSSTGYLRWQDDGAYLKLDPHTNSVFLMQDVASIKKYVPFKYLMKDFADVANEWKEILDDFAERDHTSTRIG